ncbi:MAG: energy transducer TonB [Burkholderiaceae bacterium]|nr:energy transducer TonB [Burkholderiaceae bacterium]
MSAVPAALSAWRVRIREPLVVGAIASVVFHLALLAIRFVPPVPLMMAPLDSRLEVVLLNAQTAAKPLKPEVLAQVNMEAGGDRDQGRARSPLPARSFAEDGNQVVRGQPRSDQTAAQQRRAVNLAPGHLAQPDHPLAERRTATAGDDPAEMALTIARLQAQIDRQLEDYSKRPRRLTFGVTAVGVTYAQYVAAWAAKIEQIGTEHYPAEARGRLYDSLVITVEIDGEGNVVDVKINRKSRHEVLNRAAREIVYAGAPYARFTPQMRREGDILQIVRIWSFTNEGLATETIK